jgi:hypothetical protein
MQYVFVPEPSTVVLVVIGLLGELTFPRWFGKRPA